MKIPSNKLTAILSTVLIAIVAIPCLAHATITQVDQSASGSPTSESAYYGFISATDLINNGNPLRTGATYTGSVTAGSFAALTDGTGADHAYLNAAGGTRGATYTLDIALNPLGYDITNVNSFNGFSAFWPYANQRYTISVSYVSDPDTFILLDDVTYAPFSSGGTLGSSTMVSLTDTTGVLASGVAAIQIEFLNNLSGDNQVVQEVDVIGTATIPVPEPASYALLGIGLAALTFFKKRRTRLS